MRLASFVRASVLSTLFVLVGGEHALSQAPCDTCDSATNFGDRIRIWDDSPYMECCFESSPLTLTIDARFQWRESADSDCLHGDYSEKTVTILNESLTHCTILNDIEIGADCGKAAMAVWTGTWNLSDPCYSTTNTDICVTAEIVNGEVIWDVTFGPCGADDLAGNCGGGSWTDLVLGCSAQLTPACTTGCPNPTGYIETCCHWGLAPDGTGSCKYCLDEVTPATTVFDITITAPAATNCCDFTGDGEVTLDDFIQYINAKTYATPQDFVNAMCCFLQVCTFENAATGYAKSEELFSSTFSRPYNDQEASSIWSCFTGYTSPPDPVVVESALPLHEGDVSDAPGCPDCENLSGGDDGGKCHTAQPVNAAHGNKIEWDTDLVVKAKGRDFVLSRSHTTDPDYYGHDMVGEQWTSSAFGYMFTWPTQYQGCDPPATMDPRLIPVAWWKCATTPYRASGPATQNIDIVSIGNGTFWRLHQPGKWTRDYYKDAGNLNGLLYQEWDTYGNTWRYEYDQDNLSGIKPRLRHIFVNGTSSADADAEIRFTWNLSDVFPELHGKLAFIQVFRYDGFGVPMVTQRVDYLYKDSADGIIGDIGTDGDLIQVTRRIRVDQVDTNAPAWRTLITQYRYHNGTAVGGTDERYLVNGSDHQVKLVIEPEQIEFYAQQLNASANPPVADALEQAAAALLGFGDDDSVGAPLNVPVVDLASKIISYETTGDKRVSAQYIQSACGCAGGGATQGLKMSYSYFSRSSDTERTLKVTETTYNGSSYTTSHRERYYDFAAMGDIGGPSIFYLVHKAIIDSSDTTKRWVWHYQYDSERNIEKVFMPSALSSYKTAEETPPASYSALSSDGLIHEFDYTSYPSDPHADNYLLKQSVRNGSSGSSIPIWEITYPDPAALGSDERFYLPIESVSYTDESDLVSSDKQEETGYFYTFHAASGDLEEAIASIETQVEAELVAENGDSDSGAPTTFSTFELYDSVGLNRWSRREDQSLTYRDFDAKTGRMTQRVANAAVSGSAYAPTLNNNDYGNVTITGWGTSTFGGELQTQYVHDELGRLIERIEPPDSTNGAHTYVIREMREWSERTGIYHYAQIALPHMIDQGADEFGGPARLSFYNADDDQIGINQFALDGAVYDPPALAYTTTTELARSSVDHSLSGLVESTTRWHDVSGGSYTTGYTYDALGRTETVTNPNGSVTSTSSYDVLNRALETQVGVTGSTPLTVAEYFYDFDLSSGPTPSQGVGDGNLTFARQHTGETGSLAHRDTKQHFDWRNRPVKTERPESPHEVVVYDNLDRPTKRALFGVTPPDDIDDSGSLSDRGLYSEQLYSQRGIGFRQRIAMDPTSTTSDFLEVNRWFDQNGRVVIEWSPNSAIKKNVYDGHGRVVGTYKTAGASGTTIDSGGIAGGGSAPSGWPDDGLTGPNLDNDLVVEEDELEYATTDGLLDVVTKRRRAHDLTILDKGTLKDLIATTSSKAISTYSTFYYDSSDRRIRTVDYGTNDTSGFNAGGTPPTTGGAIPDPAAGDDTKLVTATTYNERGLIDSIEDPREITTKYFYDDANRRIATAENYDNAALTWDSGNSRWSVTGLLEANPDEDRVTSVTYDGMNNVTKQVAHLPASGGETVQETEYVYDVTTTTSLVDSKDLLSAVHYPNEGTGDADDTAEYTVAMTYNRLGEALSYIDQNGTVHDFARDGLGRITQDTASSIDTLVLDDWVRALGTTYDSMGRIDSARSYSDTSATTVVNAVKFSYNGLWQVTEVEQEPNGDIDANTPSVSYAYADEDASVGNFSRMSSITYPDGNSLTYAYGAKNDVDDRISRVRSLKEGADMLVDYRRVGLNMHAIVDYAKPTMDIQLTRFTSHTATTVAGQYPGWDQYGRLERQFWIDGDFASTKPPIVELKHRYDNASNRTAKIDYRDNASWVDRDFEYVYDDLDRLVTANRGVWDDVSESIPTANASANGQEWALDMLGNWDSFWNDDDGDGLYETAEEQSRTHNEANEIETTAPPTTPSFNYDKAGNMLDGPNESGTVQAYKHDAWNRLTEVTSAGTTVGQYEYSPLHWRTVRELDTSTPIDGVDERRELFYSSRWQLLEEQIDEDFASSPGVDRVAQQIWGVRYIDDAVMRRIDDGDGQGGGPDGVYEADDTYYYVTDAQFSSVGLLREAVNATDDKYVVERVTYSPYGVARHHWGGDVNGDGAANLADDQAIVDAISAPSYFVEGDLNRDGVLDVDDRLALLAIMGSSPVPALADGVLSYEGGPDNSVGLHGYALNGECLLYYVRLRNYSPTLGRWLEQDPLEFIDGMLQYQFVRGMPETTTDPLGLTPMRKIIVVGGGSVLIAYLLGKNAARTLDRQTADRNRLGSSPLIPSEIEFLESMIEFLASCDDPKLIDYAESLSDLLSGGEITLGTSMMENALTEEDYGGIVGHIYLNQDILIKALQEHKGIIPGAKNRIVLLSTLIHESFHHKTVIGDGEPAAYAYEREFLQSLARAINTGRCPCPAAARRDVIDAINETIDEVDDLTEIQP